MKSSITKISPLISPNYVKPIAIEYLQDGVHKEWEAIVAHDAVSILLYNSDRDAFVLVKQLRPAVLHANPSNGYMYELCAGIIDKDLSNKSIAREEILEECGYDVPLDSIEKITSFYTSVGFCGALQTLYYAQINDSMIVNAGGGLAEESIEVIYLPCSQAKSFMFDGAYQKTPGVIMAFYWFFENRA